MGGDTYIVSEGQTGTVGPSSHAHDMTFTQIKTPTGSTIDLASLAKELSVLRTKMRAEAVEPDQDAAIGQVANAEIAARNGKAPQVFESLTKAGKWALDIAKQIGASLAVEAFKVALGIP